MKNLVWALALLAMFALWAQPQQQAPKGKDLVWAYPVPDKNPPTSEDKGPKKLREEAKLRSAKELLDEADLIYRYDWSCVDARINGAPPPVDRSGRSAHLVRGPRWP